MLYLMWQLMEVNCTGVPEYLGQYDECKQKHQKDETRHNKEVTSAV